MRLGLSLGAVRPDATEARSCPSTRAPARARCSPPPASTRAPRASRRCSRTRSSTAKTTATRTPPASPISSRASPSDHGVRPRLSLIPYNAIGDDAFRAAPRAPRRVPRRPPRARRRLDRALLGRRRRRRGLRAAGATERMIRASSSRGRRHPDDSASHLCGVRGLGRGASSSASSPRVVNPPRRSAKARRARPLRRAVDPRRGAR